ncbi:ssDNA endodeoxyribonuclease, partial [Irineochytrium annulatum]
LEEGQTTTICRIQTMETEPLTEMDVNFRSRPIECKLIMKSEWLRDAFSELDSSCSKTRFLISPTEPYFRLSASGLTGETQMDYPKDTELLESFQCQALRSYEYAQRLLQPSMKALSLSTKTSIRVNSEGFLSMQFMIPISESKVAFVEFLCCPSIEEEV